MREHELRPDGGVWTTTDIDGQVALVSGGTDGIGKATATRLAELGATVAVVGSTPERGRSAVEEITAASGSDDVEYVQADLSRMAEVRELATRVRESYDRLDVLVHTAGVLPTEQSMTEEGIERSFAINYLSRFLLTTLLADRLRERTPARVVNVAAAGANPVSDLDVDDLAGDRLFRDPEEGDHMVRGQGALDQAQVANDVFGVELADRLAGTGVAVTVVHPSAVDTEIRLKAGEGWRELEEYLHSEMDVVPPETVAETVVPLATTTDPEAVTGRFFRVPQTAVDHQEGVEDPDLRRALWERSADLAGVEPGSLPVPDPTGDSSAAARND